MRPRYRPRTSPVAGEGNILGIPHGGACGGDYSCCIGGNNSRNFRSWHASGERESSSAVAASRILRVLPPRTWSAELFATEKGQGVGQRFSEFLAGFRSADCRTRTLRVLNSAIESAQSGTEERPHWCEGAFKEDQRQGIYIAYLCCLPTPRVNLEGKSRPAIVALQP